MDDDPKTASGKSAALSNLWTWVLHEDTLFFDQQTQLILAQSVLLGAVGIFLTSMKAAALWPLEFIVELSGLVMTWMMWTRQNRHDVQLDVMSNYLLVHDSQFGEVELLLKAARDAKGIPPTAKKIRRRDTTVLCSLFALIWIAIVLYTAVTAY